MLRVGPAFWGPRLDPEVSARILAENLRGAPQLDPELRELAEAFVRDHPARSAAGFSD